MTHQVLESVHDDLADAIEHVHDGEPVLLECDGKPLAALVSIRDLKLLEKYIEELEDRIDLQAADEALREVERDGTVPWETVRQELGLEDD